MIMNKKDRIAVVASLTIGNGLALTHASQPLWWQDIYGFYGTIALAAYWAYRFIQNDISFFKFKDPD